MARMNPKRRLLAKLAEFDKQAHDLTVAYNAGQSDNSQIMRVSRKGDISPAHSALAKFDNKVGSLRAPRETWEGTGKRGKIVNGTFKPAKVGARQRFAKS